MRHSTKIRQTETGQEKWCPRCKGYHPADLDHFYLDKSSKTGLSSWCIQSQVTPGVRDKQTPGQALAEAREERPQEENKPRTLVLDFTRAELLYEDVLQEAEDEFRTPEMQALWLIHKALYQGGDQ